MNNFYRTGIDLGGTKIEIIVFDSRGGQIFRKRIPSPQGSYTDTVSAITELVLEADKHVHEITKVGIGIPGALSEQTGLVKNSNSKWLIGKPLKLDLEYSLKRHIKIENDANCFTVSEAVDGAGAQAHVVFGVILGTGVGGGITINAKPLRGINSIAGEWGHNPLPWTNEQELNQNKCYCGKRGCVESVISGRALQTYYHKISGKKLKFEEIYSKKDSDRYAKETLQRLITYFGKGLSNVVNIIDPEVIVLGGGLSNIDELYSCLLYTSPSPRDLSTSRMPSSA